MAKEAKDVTGKQPAKKRSDGNVTWLNPHIPAQDGRIFVDTLTQNRQELGDYLTATLSHCTGLTIKRTDDGDFTGYVFFDIVSGGAQKAYAVRSDASTPEKVLLGLLFKFVVLLGCGDELRSESDTEQFDDFT